MTQYEESEDIYIPEAIIKKILEKDIERAKEKMGKNLETVSDILEDLREELEHDKKLSTVYPDTSAIPTTCGADGSYTIQRLLGWDLVQVAAIIVEGMTPPQNTRYWADPKFFVHSSIVARMDGNTNVLRGTMVKLELHLIRHAPHEVKFIDGSIKTPFIYFHQAFKQIEQNNVSEELYQIFLERTDDVIAPYSDETGDRLEFPTIEESLSDYALILTNENGRSDRYYVAVPKAITTSYLTEYLQNKVDDKESKNSIKVLIDDRGLLNLMLNPHELVGPFDVVKQENEGDERLHFTSGKFPKYTKIFNDKIIPELEKWKVYYYKLPKGGVVRFEVPSVVANHKSKLRKVITGIVHNTQAYPAILEPYPLYLADKMVKSTTYTLKIVREQLLYHALSGNLNVNIDPYNLVLLFNMYRTREG